MEVLESGVMLELRAFENILWVMVDDIMYKVFLKYLRAAVISGLTYSHFLTLKISKTNCQNYLVSQI